MNDLIGENQQASLFKRLLAKNDNSICADCKSKGAAWASLDFGVLVCINCSGIHRSFGMHITRIRSTKLDSWILGDYKMLEAVGNQTANLYWEHGLKNKSQCQFKSEDERMSYVRSKYMSKLYIHPSKKDPITLFLESNCTMKPDEIRAYYEPKSKSDSNLIHTNQRQGNETSKNQPQKLVETHKNDINLLDLNFDSHTKKSHQLEKAKSSTDPFSFDFMDDKKPHKPSEHTKHHSIVDLKQDIHKDANKSHDIMFDFTSSNHSYSSPPQHNSHNGNIYNINNLTVFHQTITQPQSHSQYHQPPPTNYNSDPYAVLDTYKYNYHGYNYHN